jgi:hypothetical protein
MGVSGAQQEKGPSHYGPGQFAERRGQSFRSALGRGDRTASTICGFASLRQMLAR